MPSYLQLCIETWHRNFPTAEVRLINHNTLEEYSGGRLSVERLKAFSLPLQSDVAAVAVLLERPGLFLDVDTIILPGFSPSRFSNDKLTMFGNPKSRRNSATNFFYSPCAGNSLLLQWLLDANRRISYHTSGMRGVKCWLRRKVVGKPARVRWNYLGNAILDQLLAEQYFARAIDLRDAVERGYYLAPLTSENHAIAYRQFWFSSSIDEHDVSVAAKDRVLGLQNSWTPTWYAALNQREVLADSHLISRTIQLALIGNSP